MAITRKVKFDYYKIVCCKKNGENLPAVDFDLSLWIKEALSYSLVERTFEYFQEKSRLDRVLADQRGFWLLSFLRLRETNIPAIAGANEFEEAFALEEDEYISESAAALYITEIGVLMLQRNRHSLGVRGIEEYLNLLYKDDLIQIELRPLSPPNILAKINNAEYIRKLTLRVAETDKVAGFNSLLSYMPFNEAIKNLQSFNGNSINIEISAGRRRDSFLNKELVTNLLGSIQEQGHIYSKAEVKLKETDDSLVETVDLFADKLSSIISLKLLRKEAIQAEFLLNEMISLYQREKQAITEALRGKVG